MQPSDRNRRFVAAVKDVTGKSKRWHFTEMYGFSNRAAFVDGGLLIGVANLEKFDGTADGIVLMSVIDASPNDHVYFAVVLGKQGVTDIYVRIRALGAIKNNNVRMNLLTNGKLYVDSMKFEKSLMEEHGFDLAAAQPTPDVERIFYAIYPPRSTAHRSLMAGQFVGYLAAMVGRDKVEEISPWGEAEFALGPQMRRMPYEIPLEEIEESIHALGGYYTHGLVERYHLALNHLETKHFVILPGLSGTGKTSLARKYSQAVHGITNSEQDDPLFFLAPVRPDWTDPTGLLGYYDVISNRYVVPKFLEAVIAAITHRDSPVFVCIDELNNARVEYYFADVLSAMESGLGLHLHAHSTPLTGTTGGEIPSTIPLPRNLYIVGTINVDETTQTISDKVLDRAVVIDMSHVDIGGFLEVLAMRRPSLAPAVDICGAILQKLDDVLAPERLGFGYRVAEEFVRYIDAGTRLGRGDSTSLIDHQLVQKVLIKLRGSERQRDMLNKLLVVVDPYPQARVIVSRLLTDLDEYGSFESIR